MALSPPPIKDGDFPYAWQDWFRQLHNTVKGTIGSIAWATVSKAGSSLTEIVSRDHDVLQNISGGGTSHLSTAQYNSVTSFLTVYTVATLPAGVAGQRAYVSDATAPAFGAAVVGGGAVGIPVYKDGVNWKVG